MTNRRYFLVESYNALLKSDFGKYGIFRQKKVRLSEVASSPFVSCLTHRGIIGRLNELGLNVMDASQMKPSRLRLQHGDVLYVITSFASSLEDYRDADTLPETMTLVINRVTVNVPGSKDETLIEKEMVMEPQSEEQESLIDIVKQYDLSKVFFTSDTHFFDAKLLPFRPSFKDIKQMNSALVANWNSKVPEDGLVFHLGDFATGRASVLNRFIKRLNGKIVLIPGNHDSVGLYQNFDKVIVAPPIFRARFQKNYRVVMCHYPFLCYAGENLKSVWQLYGHVHSGGEDTHGMDLPRLKHAFPLQYDIGVDGNGYAPVSFYELKRIMKDRIFRYEHYSAQGLPHEQVMEIISHPREEKRQLGRV